MPDFLLHGLWIRGSGLHVWIEQTQGHRIVLPSAVPEGVFPHHVARLLDDRRFRHRLRTRLHTPRGRSVELVIPTAAYGGPAAVEFLDQLSYLDEAAPAATPQQLAAVAPDLRWLIRFQRGIVRFVRAGRVVFGLGFEDRQWWPQWQLASGVAERTWVAAMTGCAPGVLVDNNSFLVEDLVKNLPHWVVSAVLEEILDSIPPRKWHEFPQALVRSQPLKRGGAHLLHALNEWKNSIALVDLQLIVVVDEPESEATIINDEEGWPVRIQVRSGTDSPQPIHLENLDRTTKERLYEYHRTLTQVCPKLSPEQHPLGPATDPTAGDWDVLLPTSELVEFVMLDAQRLQDNGIQVMLPRAWSTAKATATVRTREASGEGSNRHQGLGLEELVRYDWHISLGDVELSEDEMRELVRSKSGLVKLRGQWVLADSRSLSTVTEYIRQLDRTAEKRLREEIASLRMQEQLLDPEKEEDQEHRASLRALIEEKERALEAGEADAVELSDLRALAIESTADEPVEFEGSPWHAALLGGTETPAPQRVEIPPSVHAELREYQRCGVDWLYWMSRNRLGAVLADDMGLGKTLQFLSLLAVERERGEASGPSLVVCPTSVVGNWAREASRFTPSAKVYVHHGTGRLAGEELERRIASSDLVITSYGIATRDVHDLARPSWDHVVLDEAQHVKNVRTRSAKAVRAFPARQRLALTGTPVENRLSEMRAILDFCNPGVLGSASFFQNHFAKAIERENDPALTARLKALTAPFILRRLKTDPAIIDDLPEKQEQILTVHLTEEQASLYTALVENIQNILESTRREDKAARRGIVLSTITRIKQICNHPAHYLGDGSPITYRGRHRSGKVAELVRLLDDHLAAGHRVLIFTQYRAFGDLLVPYLSARLGEQVPFLHGGVSKARRDAMVERFQQPDGPPVMILSLKAGGTGLNLTAASVVIHMDRWWNPAVENQATDRAYRIGQRKDVIVYKMMTAGTMEESIQQVLDGKLHLASAVVGEGEGWITELSPEDFAELMSYRGRKEGE